MVTLEVCSRERRPRAGFKPCPGQNRRKRFDADRLNREEWFALDVTF